MILQLKLGRYYTAPLVALLRRIHSAARDSRRPTPTERIAGLLDWSREHDVSHGPRPHGWDVASVAERTRATLDAAIEAEKRAQEIAFLKQTAEALDDARRAVESRLQELDAQEGPVSLLQRQREIREAGERARRADGR